MTTDQGVCPKHHWVWYQNTKPNQNSIGSFLVHHPYTVKSFEYFVYMSTWRFLLRVYCLTYLLVFPPFLPIRQPGASSSLEGYLEMTLGPQVCEP